MSTTYKGCWQDLWACKIRYLSLHPYSRQESMRMITLVFKDVGVMRVAYIMTKSLWMISIISCGSILSSSFTMPSGPDFFFAKGFDAFSKSTCIKDLGAEPLSFLESLGFILSIRDRRVKWSGIGEDMLACSQGQCLSAPSGRYLPRFVLTLFIVSKRYFSTIWACLVGLVSMVLVSGSHRASRPV